MSDVTAMVGKEAVRRAALTSRDTLDPERRIEYALALSDHLLAASTFDDNRFDPGTIVAGYHPIRSELDPRPAMAQLAVRGARLCLPAVTGPGEMEFRELIRGAPVVETGFGTIGPGAEAAVLDPQIILLPLAAFDRRGGRLGYGAGFYDRAIAGLRERGQDVILIGLAFSCQEVETVPQEAHDVRLHAIATESGFLEVRP